MKILSFKSTYLLLKLYVCVSVWVYRVCVCARACVLAHFLDLSEIKLQVTTGC